MWKFLSSWTSSVELSASFSYASWSSAVTESELASGLRKISLVKLTVMYEKLFISQKGINNVQYGSQEWLIWVMSSLAVA